MLQREIAQRLVDLEIFRGLERHHIDRIAREAERMMFRPGQTLIRAGEPGGAAYLLLAGAASVEPTEDEEAEAIVPGSLVGELAMLVEHEYAATVVCRGQVRAVRLGREMLQAQMLAEPEIAEHFVARLTSRLTRVADELRRIDGALAAASSGEPARAASGDGEPATASP